MKQSTWKHIILLGFLFILAFSVLVSVAPSSRPIPGRDQGVYLYIGRQILDGNIPYRDIWDHKGPVIYYINALGLSFGISTYWGVWLIEILFLFSALFFSYYIMTRYFSKEAAFFGTGMWISKLFFVLDGGNTVEEFTLPIQFLSVFLFLRAEEEKKHYWNEFWLGILMAIAFFIRPNNIGEGIAIILLIGIRFLFSAKTRKRDFFRLLSLASGFLSITLLIIGYFASQNALNSFWHSAFIYNFLYSGIITKRWDAFIKGASYLSPLASLGFSTWLIGIGYFFFDKEKISRSRKLLMLALLILPITLALSLTSGRKYLHYFTAWLPPLGLLAGFFAYKFQMALEKNDDVNFLAWFKPSKIWVYLLLLTFSFLQLKTSLPASVDFLKEAIQARGAPDGGNDLTGSPCQYIKEHTKANNYVLIWGNEVECNFVTQRESPSRFIYLYPLMLEGYLSNEEIESFRKDIAEKKPLIIDTTLADHTVFSPSSKRWEEIPSAAPLIKFILANYAEVDQIPNSQWKVWQIK